MRTIILVCSLLLLKPLGLLAQDAPAISSPGGERVVLSGATVALSPNVTGAPPLMYQWLFNGEILPGATNSSLLLSSVAVAQSGLYALALTNNFGAATGVVARLTVLVNPPPTVVDAWGLNDSGQSSSPTNLFGLVSVSAGGQHALGLKSDGSIVAWGNNTYHQLDFPMSLTNAIAIAAGGQHSLALRSDGTVAAWGDNSSGQCDVPATLSNVTAIAAGAFHSLALRSNGTVLAWGNNACGQCAPPSGITNATAVSGGGYFSAVLLSTGRVLVWGYNGTGQTNVPPTITNAIAIAAGFNHCLALQVDATVTAWGYNGAGQTSVPANLLDVAAISAGFDHSLALKADGAVVGWGGNAAGQSSPPTTLTRLVALAAGNSFNVGLSPAPVIRLQPLHQLLVPGSNITFSVAAESALPMTIQWLRDGTNLPGETNASLTLTNTALSDAGTYSAIVSNYYGAVSSSSALLSLRPVILAPPTSQIAQPGQNVLFAVTATSAAPLSYQWQFKELNIPGATNATYLCTNAQAAHVGEYRVLISSTPSSIFGAMFSPPAWLALVSSNQLAPLGASVSLSITSALTAAYQWQFHGTNLAGQTHRSLTLTNLQLHHAGNYRVVADDGVAPVVSPDIVLSLIVPPTITQPPVSQAVARGSDATFTVVAAGTPPLRYQWRFQNAPVSGATNTTLVITNCQLANLGDYSVVVTNSSGAVTSLVAVLELTSLPPWFASHPATRVAWSGQNATLTASPGGDLPLSLQWVKDGAVVPGETNASLVLSHLTTADSGRYSLRASNVLGVGFSSNATLRVISVPSPGSVTTWGSHLSGLVAGYVPPDVCGAVAVSGATSHSLALLSDGTVRIWGANDFNQLQMPAGLAGIAAISGGHFHSIALRQDGGVVVWGDNFNGSSTVPPGLKPCIAVSAGGGHNLVLQEDGSVAAWGNNYSGECNVPPGLSNVVDVAAGVAFSLALKADGTVAAWGNSAYGQTQLPPGLSNVVALAPGFRHSLALKQNGTVIAWGDNLYGACNVPTGLTDVVAIAAGGVEGGGLSLALKADGTLVGWGTSSYGALTFPPGLSNLTAVASGASHVLALQPGLRTSEITMQPTSVTTNAGVDIAFSVGVSSPPLSYQWQWNGAGVPGATTSSISLTNVQALDAGDYTVVVASCSGSVTSAPAALTVLPSAPAIAAPLRVKTRHVGQGVTFRVGPVAGTLPVSYQWYSNDIPILLATNASVAFTNLQLHSAGNYCVRVSNSAGLSFATNVLVVLPPAPIGSVIEWNQTTNEVPSQGISGLTAIASAHNSGVGLRADGTVVAWDNSLGQTAVPASATNAIAVAAGAGHGSALSDNGTVTTWGYIVEEQAAPPAGLDEVEAIACGLGFDLAAKSDGTVVFWGNPGSAVRNVPAAATNVIAVAAGDDHALALRRDGTIVAWGGDQYGETSGPSAESNVVAIAAGHWNSVVLRQDGSVRAFGLNSYGQTNVPSSLTNAVAISCAYARAYAVTGVGDLVGWGQNDWGQLSPPPGATNLLSVAAGLLHTLVLKKNGIFVTEPPQTTTVPAGTNVTFTVRASGPGSLAYQWLRSGTNIAGATNTTLILTNVQYSDAGVYSVNVTSSNRDYLSAPATLTVLSPPFFLVPPVSQAVRSGSNATFWAHVSGTPLLYYQWLSNGVAMPGKTATNLVLSKVTTETTNAYQLRAFNSFGAITSAPALLSVLWPPRIQTQPLSQGVVIGSNATFTLGVSGAEPLTYRWQFNQTDIPTGTNATLTLTAVAPDAAGSYRVVLSNPYGAITSAPAILTVYALAPAILTSPTNRTAPVGSTVSFAVAASGAAPLYTQWRRNGAPLPGETAATLALTNVQGSYSGAYDAVVTNMFGAATSSPALLQVGPNPNVVAWGLNDKGQTNVPAHFTNIVAVSAGYTHALALRADGTVDAWGANNAGQLNIPAGLSNVIAVAAGNAHSLALRADRTVAGWGANNYAQAVPPAGLSNVIAITTGVEHSLALKNDGTVVGWGYNSYGQASPPASLSNAVAIAAAYDHSLALRSDGTIATWGADKGDPAGISNVVAISGKSFHFLLLRKDGTILGWPSRTVEGPTNPAAVSAGGYSALYAPHNLALLTNGMVSAWGTNTYGQATPPAGLSNVVAVSAGSYFSVALKGGPEFITHPLSQTVAEGQPVSFTTEAYSFLPTTLQWELDGTIIVGATNSTLFLPVVQFAQRGNYTLLASNRLGATRSAIAVLTVVPQAPRLTSSPTNQTVVSGGMATFTVTALGAGSLTYQWRFNGYDLPGATGTSLVISNVDPGDVGSYAVVVNNPFGSVETPPAALFVVPPDLIVDDPQAQVIGLWYTSLGSFDYKFGNSYRYKFQGPGANNIKFVPNIPADGVYQVYEWHPQGPTRSAVAPYVIEYASGSQLISVNQQINGGRWNLLGAFPFAAGTNGSVRVSDAFPEVGRTVVADAIKLVYAAPPLILVPLRSQTVMAGDAAQFTVTAASSSPVHYSWQKDGHDLAGASLDQFYLPDVHLADAGTYRVTVHNSGGSATSEATLNVALPLAISSSAGLATLNWTGPFALQTATNLPGPYYDVPGAASPWVITTTDDLQRFFRLRPAP